MKMPRIKHFAAGGTLDSAWDPVHDTARPSPISIVESYLKKTVRLKNLESETIVMKDSREVSMEERSKLSNAVAEALEKRILVTCGTYLMPDIAREIIDHPMAEYFEMNDKTIVLTGALKPMRGYLSSDGGFNLGMSSAVLHYEKRNGIFIVMNNSCFAADTVRKDPHAARFHASNGSDILDFDNFKLITAGGTMDFELDGLDGLVPSKKSWVPNFLRSEVRSNRSFDSLSPFVKDSRDLRDPDLDMICKMIKESKSTHILVTMGIYRLRKLQNHLRKFLGENSDGKKIIITGSRFPLSLGDETDASFQLGYALGCMGYVEPGVHIAINGRLIGDDQDLVTAVFNKKEIQELVNRGVVKKA